MGRAHDHPLPAGGAPARGGGPAVDGYTAAMLKGSDGAAVPDGGAALSERQVDIVRCAYRLFAERGVQRVPLHEIAAAAGMSKGIVLYYFKTKDQLVGAAMVWVL